MATTELRRRHVSACERSLEWLERQSGRSESDVAVWTHQALGRIPHAETSKRIPVRIAP